MSQPSAKPRRVDQVARTYQLRPDRLRELVSTLEFAELDPRVGLAELGPEDAATTIRLALAGARDALTLLEDT